jgi:hypothetical protein
MLAYVSGLQFSFSIFSLLVASAILTSFSDIWQIYMLEELTVPHSTLEFKLRFKVLTYIV